MQHEPIIYWWSSTTGGTRSVARRLNTPTAHIDQYDTERPYILMVPSYGSPRTGGYIPKQVQHFLDKHGDSIVGVIGTGNLCFQEDYCKAAHLIARRHNVPVLWRIDLRGDDRDIQSIDHGVKQHWHTLVKGEQ